jgi:hypothetical protein
MTEAICSCGERLLDGLSETDVRVGDEEYRFARRTDHVVCDACGAVHRIGELREGTDDAAGTQEAVAALRELTLLDAAEDDPSRTLGRVPPED